MDSSDHDADLTLGKKRGQEEGLDQQSLRQLESSMKVPSELMNPQASSSQNHPSEESAPPLTFISHSVNDEGQHNQPMKRGGLGQTQQGIQSMLQESFINQAPTTKDLSGVLPWLPQKKKIKQKLHLVFFYNPHFSPHCVYVEINVRYRKEPDGSCGVEKYNI